MASPLTKPTPERIKRLAAATATTAPLKRIKLDLRCAGDGISLLLMFFVGRFPVRRLRHAVYRLMGVQIGQHACLHRGLEVRAPRNIRIGEGSIIGFDSILDGRSGIQIGRHVMLSSSVAIWTRQHDTGDPQFGVVGGPVVVGDRAWLSFRATVLPGVTVGEGAVVAAGAVVTKNVPAYKIVAGVPARVIGDRQPRGLTYELSAGFTPWFV
jgi:acetyltransferase-like isoleucine patch superfamily enzyme